MPTASCPCARRATAPTTSRAWRSSRSGLGRTTGAEAYRRMLARSLGFLRHAWSAELGGMHNFMSYDRRWLDEPHGGDHFGARRLGAGRSGRGRSGPRAARAQPDPAARDAARAGRAALAAHDGLRRDRAGPRRPRTARRRRRRRPARSRRAARRPAARQRVAGLVLGRGRADLRQRPAAAGADRRRRPARATPSWCARGSARSVVRDRARDRRRVPATRRASRPPPRGASSSGSGDEQPLDAAALVEAEVEAFVATGDERHARDARARVRVVPGPQPAPAVGLRLRHRRLSRRPRRVGRQRQRGSRVDARLPPGAARPRRRRPPGRPCPNEAGAPRTDRLAHASPPLRAVGARHRAPGRRPRPARRRRDALRHAGLDHHRTPRRGLRAALRGGPRRSTAASGRRSTSPTP